MAMETLNKILVVDDNPTNVEILEEVLEKHYWLKSVENGEEALEIVADFQPDLILLDIMMPGIDGYEVCRRIRENQALRYAKIIMVSAKAMVQERLKGYEVGADDYVTKPFKAEELLAKICVYMRLKSVEEVNQLKSDVFSLLCHETRTPLNGILSPSELLMSDENMDLDERKVWGAMVNKSATRLLRFFEKVLTYVELKSGNSKSWFEQVSLSDVIHGALIEVTSQAIARDVAIDLELSGMKISLMDPEGIKFVIVTILENAIRFSDPGGHVSIRSSMGDGKFKIEITDRGEGIDPSLLPYVFDGLFVAEVKYHKDGFGMNLAIARQIVLRHNGTISVRSSKGRSTTFLVQLPHIWPPSED